jgi:hypothetical protein
MKTAWQDQSGCLVCRWSDLPESDESTAPVVREALTEPFERFEPSMPNFAAHSPLGSGEWFVPWNYRWRVPRAFIGRAT